MALDAVTKVPLGNCRETFKRCPFPSDDVEAGLNYLSPVLQDMFVVMDCTAARDQVKYAGLHSMRFLTRTSLSATVALWRLGVSKTDDTCKRIIPLGSRAIEIVQRWTKNNSG